MSERSKTEQTQTQVSNTDTYKKYRLFMTVGNSFKLNAVRDILYKSNLGMVYDVKMRKPKDKTKRYNVVWFTVFVNTENTTTIESLDGGNYVPLTYHNTNGDEKFWKMSLYKQYSPSKSKDTETTTHESVGATSGHEEVQGE